MSNQDRHFNATKVFYGLFALTALEVAWGLILHDAGRLILWGGLLICAFFKGLLIAAYFMHLKFEGWIVKTLIIPTPFLVLVIAGYVMTDVSNGDETNNLIHPVGSQLDKQTGIVDEGFKIWQKPHHESASGQAGESNSEH